MLGAGPAGLAAAWRAARAGHEVTVLEAADRVGGMAASHSVAGVRVDLGSHRLHPSTARHVLAALRHLLGDDLQERPRHGRINLAGRWLGFPLETRDLLLGLPPRFAVGAARDAVAGPLRRARRDTFAEVVSAGLGPTITRAFYDPYIRKIWGVAPTELAGELARRRVSASGPADIVRRLVRRDDARGRTFLYPRGGFGRISEVLADAAVEAGATIRLRAPVSTVTVSNDGVRVGTADGAEVTVGRVLSTLPLALLARLVHPASPLDVALAADRLQHRGLVLVYLVLDRPRWTEFDAHYFPDLDVPLARLSEPKGYRDDPEDPADVTVLCAEIPCTVGDETWFAPPDELGDRVAAALGSLGLPDATPVATEVRRLPRVYPLYRPGFVWDLAAVELWLGELDRVVTLGRQGLFVPDNTHHALAMGWAAADALGSGGCGDDAWDAAGWATARSGFRSHIVED